MLDPYLKLQSFVVAVGDHQANAAALVVGDAQRDHAQDLHVLEASVAATRQGDLLLHPQVHTDKTHRTISISSTPQCVSSSSKHVLNADHLRQLSFFTSTMGSM